MKLYLDMCALKRPFDDQIQERIASETHAVLAIMGRIERGLDSMVWSTALTLENDADPDPEPRIEVAKYAVGAGGSLSLTPQVEKRIREFTAAGLRPLDAAPRVRGSGRLRCTAHVLRPIRRARRTNGLFDARPDADRILERGRRCLTNSPMISFVTRPWMC